MVIISNFCHKVSTVSGFFGPGNTNLANFHPNVHPHPGWRRIGSTSAGGRRGCAARPSSSPRGCTASTAPWATSSRSSKCTRARSGMNSVGSTPNCWVPKVLFGIFWYSHYFYSAYRVSVAGVTLVLTKDTLNESPPFEEFRFTVPKFEELTQRW